MQVSKVYIREGGKWTNLPFIYCFYTPWTPLKITQEDRMSWPFDKDNYTLELPNSLSLKCPNSEPSWAAGTWLAMISQNLATS